MSLSNIGSTVLSLVLFLGFVTSVFDALQHLPIADVWGLYILVKTAPAPAAELGDAATFAGNPHQWPPRTLLW